MATHMKQKSPSSDGRFVLKNFRAGQCLKHRIDKGASGIKTNCYCFALFCIALPSCGVARVFSSMHYGNTVHGLLGPKRYAPLVTAVPFMSNR
jgi:hypothetical protein